MVCYKFVTSYCHCEVVLEEEDPNVLDEVAPNPNFLSCPHLSRPKTYVTTSFGTVSNSRNGCLQLSHLQLLKLNNYKLKSLKQKYNISNLGNKKLNNLSYKYSD